jgi:hypothetical protein
MAIKTFNAGADLSDKIGHAVITNATNKEVIVASANADCIGILTNDGIENEAIAVALVGELVKGKLGEAVSFGDPLKATTGGTLIEAGGTGDDNVIAVAMEDGSSGDLIYVNVVKFVK